jgi:hypothetical protein
VKNTPNNDNDGEKLKWALEIHKAFTDMMIRAELAVFRKRLASLIAKVDQTSDVQALEGEILRDVAALANNQIAEMADYLPGGATAVADLLQRWKHKHGI